MYTFPFLKQYLWETLCKLFLSLSFCKIFLLRVELTFLNSDISQCPRRQQENVTRKVLSRLPVYFTCILHHLGLYLSTAFKKKKIIQTSKGLTEMLMSRSKINEHCACVASKRKPYLRKAEAVTSFLLPDCHHGKSAMRVLAFLIRISVYISQCSVTTRVVYIANAPMSIIGKCLCLACWCFSCFSPFSVRCRQHPALQRGPSACEGRELLC